MNSNQSVSHSGKIVNIDESTIRVLIVSKSACASCQIKSACNMSDSKEKFVEIKVEEGSNYQIGQEVEVLMAQSQGKLAVFLGYVLPFLLVFATLIILILLHADEGFASLVSLAVLIPYYLILKLSDKKISKKFSFRIKE